MGPMIGFHYVDPSKRAEILAELDEDGIVTFVVQASKDSLIRGTELFRRMLAAFGDDARAIRGAWTKGTGPSTNIDEVNQLTAAGMPLEEAVLKAWTVTRARKFGFDRVKVLRFEGMPGAYAKIEVLIEK